MKIAVLADQHGSLPPIPPCDLLILSGDVCGGPDYVDGKWRPDLSDAREYDWLKTDFARWVSGTPRAIVVAGNHDTCIEKFGFPAMPSVTYLQDSGCEIGGLKFWGTPWIRRFDDLAFNATETELCHRWLDLPTGIDVLVCHGPPRSNLKLDEVRGEHVGSVILFAKMMSLTPKILTCGHIHEGRGIYEMYGVKVVKAAYGFIEVEL